MRNELFNSTQELDRLRQIIKEKNPLYYQRFLDSAVITIQDVRQNILNDHHALVELFSGDSAVYVFIISEHNINFKKIDKASFKNVSDSFMFYISSANLLNRNYNVFTKFSGQLYQLIFQNISLAPGRIIISPDGQYFPFEALVTSSGTKPLTYFLNDYSVSYTYSARYLLNAFATKSGSTASGFMGMAPVQYAGSMHLPALSGSDQSLQKLRSYFGSAYNLFGANASKKTLCSSSTNIRSFSCIHMQRIVDITVSQ